MQDHVVEVVSISRGAGYQVAEEVACSSSGLSRDGTNVGIGLYFKWRRHDLLEGLQPFVTPYYNCDELKIERMQTKQAFDSLRQHILSCRAEGNASERN